MPNKDWLGWKLVTNHGEKQSHFQGPLFTSRKYPGYGWLRLVTDGHVSASVEQQSHSEGIDTFDIGVQCV